MFWTRSLANVRLATLRYSLLNQKIWPVIFYFLLRLKALDYYVVNVGSAVSFAASMVQLWEIQSCLCSHVQKTASLFPWLIWTCLGVLLQR